MDRWEAQYQFWSSFGIPAYPEDAVPDRKDITFPYITYQPISGGFGAVMTQSASVWTRSTSWEEADKKADEIERYIRSMGFPKIDGGRYRVFIPDSVFAQSMGDPNDDQIKRKLLSVQIEFMTEEGV